jgi:hypothetical protein
VVYCKDANRQESHSNEKFDFLGFTFRPRKANGRKGIFCSFIPAISKNAAQKIRDEIRGWKLHRCTGQSIQEIARKINPKRRGWFNYYGRFTPSALRPIERHVGQSLVRWACRKYKKLRNHRSRGWTWLIGPPHVDTFDYKPALAKYHGKPMPTENPKTERLTGNLLASPFAFRKFGQSGLEISEIFSRLGKHADDTCIIRSMHTDRLFHDAGLFMMNCGHNLAGRPSMTSWITYGLGGGNRNLPGFVVLCPGLPTVRYAAVERECPPGHVPGNSCDEQGNGSGEADPESAQPPDRRRPPAAAIGSDFRAQPLQAEKEANPLLESGIAAMETAFRMQSEASDAFDIGRETEATRARYGQGDFARGCLIARRSGA